MLRVKRSLAANTKAPTTAGLALKATVTRIILYLSHVLFGVEQQTKAPVFGKDITCTLYMNINI